MIFASHMREAMELPLISDETMKRMRSEMFNLKRGFYRFIAAGVVGIGLALSAQPAAALILLDDWDLNLSILNGEDLDNGSTLTLVGLVDALGIDHINVVGEANVEQDVVLNVALGQDFIESGVLQFTTFSPEAGGGVGFFNVLLGNALTLYIEFTDLTGTLNNDGSITFDPGAGTIELILDEDNDLDSSTGRILVLATFEILDPSGGSNLDFFGGAGANATIDITLALLSVIKDDLFEDEFGNNLDVLSLTFHLVNTDALLVGGIDNSGLDINGTGVSKFTVQNNGQWNLAVVPEPSTLALFGFGLIAFGLVSARRRRTAHTAID